MNLSYPALIDKKETKRNSLLWRENLRSFLKNGMLARFFQRSNTTSSRYWPKCTRSIAIHEPRSPTEIAIARTEWRRTVLARSRADSKCPTILPRVSRRTTHACVRHTISRNLLLLPRGGLACVTSLSHLTLFSLHRAAITAGVITTCSRPRMMTLLIVYLPVNYF